MRGTYSTKQRERIRSVLADAGDAFFTVDDVCARLAASGAAVGRTTVYRTLESLADEGSLAKVADIRGGAARYRVLADADEGQAGGAISQGQLRCISCGRVIPLDCGMLASFTSHVQEDHGFRIDPRRTVLYGTCAQCLAAGGEGDE